MMLFFVIYAPLLETHVAAGHQVEMRMHQHDDNTSVAYCAQV